MDTGTFHELHDTGDKYLFSVTDRINLDFLTNNIFIYQNRLILIYFHGILQVMTQHLFIRYDFHGTSAKHEARSYQYRITNLGCCLHTAFNIGNGNSLRMWDSGLLNHIFKEVTILGIVDGFTACSNDRYALFGKGLCQIDRGLSS